MHRNPITRLSSIFHVGYVYIYIVCRAYANSSVFGGSLGSVAFLFSRDTTVRLSRVLTLVWQLFGIGLGVSVYVLSVMCTHMHVA